MIIACSKIQASNTYLILMNYPKTSIFRFRERDSIAHSFYVRLSVWANFLDRSTSRELPLLCSQSEIEGTVEDCKEREIMLVETDCSRNAVDLGGWLFRQS